MTFIQPTATSACRKISGDHNGFGLMPKASEEISSFSVDVEEISPV